MCGKQHGRQLLTEIKGEVRVVVSLSVGDEVDLILPALLLEALLGAPVLTHAAARDDEDQSQHQPEPCRQPTVNTVTAYLNRHYCIQTQNLCELQ